MKAAKLQNLLTKSKEKGNMEIISIQEVEKAIADYRAAEQALAKHFGLKPVKRGRPAKQRTVAGKTLKATNGKANGKAISSAQLSARQMQGKYLGAIRQLSAAKKARVQKERAKNGVKAAIALAKSLQ